MDLLYWIYDKLVLTKARRKKRECARLIEGEGYFCVPSGKYSKKSLFQGICPHVDIMKLDPLRLRECSCTVEPISAPGISAAAKSKGYSAPSVLAETDAMTARISPDVPSSSQGTGIAIMAAKGAQDVRGAGAQRNADSGAVETGKQEGDTGKEKDGQGNATDESQEETVLDVQSSLMPGVDESRLKFTKLAHTIAPRNWITIMGEIANLTDDKFRFISLEICYFDKAEAEIQRTVTIVTNLNPGTKQKIRFSKKVPGYDHFKIGFRNIIPEY